MVNIWCLQLFVQNIAILKEFFRISGRKSSWLHLILGVVAVEVVSAFCNAKPNKVPVAKNKGNKDKKIGVKSTVIIAFWQESMN